jgi:hypothetical protein
MSPKYTLDFLDNLLKESKSIIIGDYDEKKLNRETIIKFKCHCGNQDEMRFRTIEKNNSAKCKFCKKQNRKYTLNFLNKLLEDSNSTIIGNYDEEKLIYNSIIKFRCFCGNESEKKLKSIKKNGAKCKDCTIKIKKEKAKITMSKIYKKSFLEDYPELEKEWFYEKNNELKLYPEKLSSGSKQKIWWKCIKKSCHIWEAVINSRTGGKQGCPICSNQQICSTDFCNSLNNYCLGNKEYEHLISEWNSEKNGSMKEYLPFSSKKVRWNCRKKKCHYWNAIIVDRTNNKKGCPICANQLICPTDHCNSLHNFLEKNKEYKYIIDEWDEENGSIKEYFPFSNIRLKWKCLKKQCHKWQVSINNRISCRSGCPICSGKKICQIDYCNTLYSLITENKEKYKSIIDEWNYEKNKSMKEYYKFTQKKVYWKCNTDSNHFWITSIFNRIQNNSCCYFCNISKFEKICATYFLYNNIEFIVQKKYDDTKNICKLPYDFYLPEYNLDIELQGEQHFTYNDFFYKTISKFQERLETDIKKALLSLRRGQNFLSISYNCLTYIKDILDNVLLNIKNNSSQFIRFYISKDTYIDLFDSIQDNNIIPNDDEILKIHSIYQNTKKCLQNNIIQADISYCHICKDYYLSEQIKYHYHTNEHYNFLKEKYEDNLIGINTDGNAIILIED